MDVIFLSGLTTECIIGIWDWERRVKQTVVIDLEMSADIPRAAADRARAAGAKFYTIVPGEVERVRLVPSWATTPAEVDALITTLGG